MPDVTWGSMAELDTPSQRPQGGGNMTPSQLFSLSQASMLLL